MSTQSPVVVWTAVITDNHAELLETCLLLQIL
jgi:hypothetical protein